MAKSLLQEIVEQNGTAGLNKSYVDTALANGGGYGATAVTPTRPMGYVKSTTADDIAPVRTTKKTVAQSIISNKGSQTTGGTFLGGWKQPEAKEKKTPTAAEIAAQQKEAEEAAKRLSYLESLDLNAQKKKIDALTAESKKGAKLNVHAFGGYDPKNMTDTEMALAEAQEDYNLAKSLQYSAKGKKALEALDSDIYAHIDNMALWKVSASKFRKKTGKDNVSEDLQALYDAGLTLADIEQLVDYRKRQINEDQYDERVKKMQELASRDDLLGISDMGAVAASILSVPLNLGSGAGYLDLLNQKAYIEGAGYDRPLDYKTGAMSLYGQASAARETVSQGIMDNAETELGGQVGSFLYQTGMSMADSAVVAALGALGLGTAGTVLLGGSAATAAAVDAKNRGGSDSQALWSGALAGAAETVFEKISIDNLLTGKYTKNFVGSEFKKLLADVGVQGAVEGSEELFTEFANHITDRAIMGGSSNYAKSIREYMDAGMTAAEAKAKADADFAVECATSFVGGVFSGGVMGSAASAMRQDGGYTTALTENDQKVIDKLVADKIAEAEKEGKKLTDKAARKAVMEDMEKGRISIDTIEEVLGGDEYGAFANLKSEADEFNTLYETEGGKLTEKQKDRLAELKAKNQATPYEKALQDAKSKLSQSVYDRAKGGRLVESYNERARMTQDYVADFDKIKGLKHEDAARKTIESAMALSPNNSNRVHDMIDLAAKTAGDTGLSVTFANGEQVKSDYIARQTAAIKEIESVPESERTTEQAQLLEEMKAQLAKVESGEITVNGTITEDGIVLNIDSPNPLNRLLGHEVLHNLKSKRYQAVRDAVLKYANDKGIDTEKKLAEYAARYAGVKNADPEAEFVADMVGDLLYSDAEFVRRLSVENQNVFQWLWNEIKHMYKLATAGSREARDLARIQKTFEDAYRTNGKPEQADEGTVFDAIVGTKKAAKSGVDYSISSQPDTSFTAEEITAIQNIGRKSVNAFDSDDIAATEKFARRYYEEMGTKSPFFRAWFGDWRSKDSSPVNVVTKQGDTRTDHVNKDTGWTIRNSRMVHNETISHQSLIHQEAVPYLPYIDEIIENAVLLDTGGIGKLKSENSLLMHYLYAVADIGNGQEVLKLRVEEMYDPGKKGTNKRAYILQNIEKAFAVSGMVQGNAPSHGTSTTNAVNTVADLFALVKHMDGDFTPSDASTVVNEDGTPKVMYHGTDGEFTIFDPIINGGKNGVAEGYGLYFTDASEVAEAYGDRLMQTYINIKKPATSFEKTIKQTALAKLIKASCEAQAKQFVSDGDCDSIKDAIRDTWVSNYVYTYDMTMDTAYRQVAATIISAEDHDMGIVQEVMAGMGIRSYEEAYDFYAILKETLGIDGFITEWESKDGDTSQVALAFDSEQVKSATENIGTFDKSNPDINHSLSDSGEQFAPLTDFDFFGKDFRKQDAAPTQESGDIAPKKETLPEPTTDRERRKAKSYEQSKRLVATQSSERQAYLRDKYEQHKAELDALEVGDRLVGDGGNVIGEVVDKSPWGITIAGDSFMESIPTGTFAGDGVIGFLEVGDGHFEKAEVDETKTTAPVVSAENATVEDIAPVAEKATPVDVSESPVLNRLNKKLSNSNEELENNKRLRDESGKSFDEKIAKAQAELDAKANKDTQEANAIKRRIERLQRLKADRDAEYEKRISDISARVSRTEENIAKYHLGMDRAEKAVERIDKMLEYDKAELEKEYNEKREALKDRNAYISNKASELYDEIRNLKKGVRASALLGELLDSGYEWSSIRSALTNIKYTPDQIVNVNSAAEARAREILNEDYENSVYNLDEDYAAQVKQLEDDAAKKRKSTTVAHQRKKKQQEYYDQMAELAGDTSTWVDKKLGISYRTNTLKRNLRDIVRDAKGNRDIAKADAIYNELQGKYNTHEAMLNRESTQIKQPYADMKITKAEDEYIQMLGEFRHNPDTTLTEDVVKEFYEKHKKDIDTAKVDKAIEMARQTYDELLIRVNNVLREQGMKEIPYRKGYFPHFTEEKQNFLAKLFNWKVRNNDIPTDIAGLTENFNPNRSWQSFNKQRKSDITDYSFTRGMDTYVQGALDWVYHIEDIQKRRAFENYIRYIHSDKGVQEKIDAIKRSNEYDADEAQEQIDLVLSEARNPLNNFVTDLRAGTNTLANKKSSLDRTVEELTSRKFYSVMTNVSNRVSANMVAGSISSALTNFIPITQSWGVVSPISSLRAMGDTLRSTFRDDGMVNKSDFLTNRLRKADNLYKTGWDKVSDKVGLMMEAVDSFTSRTVWRSKYLENISNGMSENEAITNADQFAESVMAGRSRGNMPTIFDSKNPLVKTLTAFQLEVANQYGYMFKDMPQDMKNESVGKLVKGYATMFLGAYAYNALYSSLTGRDAAFDPIGIIEELLRDLGLFGEDEEEEPVDAVMNLAENVLEEVPFVGGLMGGGRIPISSAIPYDGNVTDFIEGASKLVLEGDTSDLTTEWLKPVYYMALPMGGGQIKKSVQGLQMFSDKHPVAGSYTSSGNLRFPVEDTFANRVKAAMFGQYANKNAREYFDSGFAPLKEKQIKEFAAVDMPISEYWEYRKGLAQQKTVDEKLDYIAGLDLPIAKKNILANNAVTRKTPIDMADYK